MVRVGRRRKLAITIARVIINGPYRGSAHTTVIREFFLQRESLIVVVADPLIIPDQLHRTGIPFDETRSQGLFLYNALDLAAAQNTSLGGTVAGSAGTTERTARMQAAGVGGCIPTAIIGETKGEFGRINPGGPQGFQMAVYFLEISMGADTSTKTWVVLVPRAMEVISQDIEPVDVCR